VKRNYRRKLLKVVPHVVGEIRQRLRDWWKLV